MKRTAIFKIFLGAAVIILLAVILKLSLSHRMAENPPGEPEGPEKTGAELSINNFKHTATEKGKTQWRLVADSADFFSDSNRVRLSELSVIFSPESAQSKTHLTADTGVLYLKTHDMDISGNIIIENQQYRLKTETLHYSHESHIISTEKPVDIVEPEIQLRADAMTVDMQLGRMECRGNVEATIHAAETFKAMD